MIRKLTLMTLFSVLMVFTTGCSGLYYNTMEKFGVEKRDILVDRVKDARNEQQKAKEEFASALEEFQAVVGYEGGNLERQYRKLNGEFEDVESRAGRVRDRIDSIENVAEALFKEWERELEQYSSPEFRRTSERQLIETRRRYEDMMRLMEDAASKMDPVLAAFRDQVLFLKHNLNAQAIASLEGNVAELQEEIALLIADMEASIAEADAFIAQMQVE